MLNTYGKTLSADKTTRIIDAAKRKSTPVAMWCFRYSSNRVPITFDYAALQEWMV
jgi:hypothetical protein